jgi:hypothetical protein
MATLQELEQTADAFRELQWGVFFEKLAELGLQPETQEEAAECLIAADQLVSQYPMSDDTRPRVKQAAMSVFTNVKSAGLMDDGYCVETHDIIEKLCGDREFVKDASLLFGQLQN